ncbi:MAG: stage IV sporulation protein A [Bacillota bacterium]|nr:stage IV sporulation protein A [Bacillota bacterium]MDD3297574.1 stage IV sporulation protein A [Bacillota bacterium]MDD3850177.1 stage IV sporulation protein A [Bacillota bacterium]MDD4707279.1 stage IV sporulation protein A [Bacillota bacterium]
MGEFNIYKDIAERTQGDIYIGIVGPVRTGKSTFIKRFMDLLVLPNIDNLYIRERAKDELPQSGAGRTISTTEPKFVPNEAVEIVLKDNAKFRVRLVDCVGYMVKGAMGHLEDEMPRMVSTPWFENKIPFEEAAELGTRKVINDHATIGLLVTTDGSITEIPRQNYIQAEERVVKELKSLNKPFVMILNSTRPRAEETRNMAEALEAKYEVPVCVVDCMNMSMDDVHYILERILFEFPVTEIHIDLPRWVDGLDLEHWLRQDIIKAVRESTDEVKRLKDTEDIPESFSVYEFVETAELDSISLGEGIARISIKTEAGLFYRVIGEITGYSLEGEHQLLGLVEELSGAKKQYDRVASAIKDVWENGYGVVSPKLDELILEEPEIFKQGSRFGVKLKASAPSIHMIRADIQTEVSPLVGTEKQSEELLNYLISEFENNPSKLWESNIFGKSLYDLVREQLQNKLLKMPEDAQSKLQFTLQRIVNEGSGGLICIIL